MAKKNKRLGSKKKAHKSKQPIIMDVLNPIALLISKFIPKQVKHKKLFVFAVFLAVWFGVWFTAHTVRVAIERNQYNHATQELNNLYEEIVADVGKPDKTEFKPYCHRSSIKYEKGPLACFITRSFSYVLDSEADAITFSKNIDKQIASSSRIKGYKPYSSPLPGKEELNLSSFDLPSIKDCSTDMNIEILDHELNPQSYQSKKLCR